MGTEDRLLVCVAPSAKERQKCRVAAHIQEGLLWPITVLGDLTGPGTGPQKKVLGAKWECMPGKGGWVESWSVWPRCGRDMEDT